MCKNFRSQIQTALDEIPYPRGTTNTFEAIRYAREVMFTPQNGDRPNERNVIVIITDGESVNRTATLQQAQQAKAEGIHIIALAVGNWQDKYEINSMASYPSRVNAIYGSNFTLIAQYAVDIQYLVCDSEY